MASRTIIYRNGMQLENRDSAPMSLDYISKLLTKINFYTSRNWGGSVVQTISPAQMTGLSGDL